MLPGENDGNEQRKENKQEQDPENQQSIPGVQPAKEFHATKVQGNAIAI
jgi:hypothetical protein